MPTRTSTGRIRQSHIVECSLRVEDFEAMGRRPQDQYRLTKALVCHEAGHRRFTSPAALPPHIRTIINILQGERIERLMKDGFAGVRPLLKELSGAMLGQARPLKQVSDEPAEVFNFVLQLRRSERAGVPVNGALSAKNQERRERIEDLVFEAWSAENSEVCDRNAEAIAEILDIKEPDIPHWLKVLLEKLERVEGERDRGDPAEVPCAGGGEGSCESDDGGEPVDGEPLRHEHPAGTTEHALEPNPYLELIAAKQPLVRKLVEELVVDFSVAAPEAAERGGMFSMREYMRDRERPFMVPQEERRAPPTPALRLVIDHSTSMNHDGRIEHAALASMVTHLASCELGVPHEIVATPHDIRVANLASGERGLVLIAGIVPAKTGWEDTGLAVQCHGAELLARPEDIKLLLVIHGGKGNDYELLTEECKKLRDKVLILAVGIGMGDREAGLLKEQFGPDRYIHCASPAELAPTVGAILRAVRGV